MAPSDLLEEANGAHVQGRARLELDIHLPLTFTLTSPSCVVSLSPILEKVGTTGGSDADEGSWFPFIKYMASLDIPAILTALSLEAAMLGTVAAVGASI